MRHASGGLIIRTNARAGANDRLEFVQALCRSTVGTVYDNIRNWLIFFKQLDGISRPVASGPNVNLKETVFWRGRECKWMPLEYGNARKFHINILANEMGILSHR